MNTDRSPAPADDVSAKPMTPRRRTLALTTCCLVAATLLLQVTPGVELPLHTAPTWMAGLVVIGFILSEPLVFHVEARNEAVSFSPSDIPLAMGLLLLPVPVLLAARIIGSAIALQYWRRPPTFKLLLNLGAFSVEATVAALVLRLSVRLVGGTGPMLWIALVGALLAGLVIGGVVIATAISFFEGDGLARVRREFSHIYLFYGPGAVLGATIAVPYLVLPWLSIVYLVPTAAVWALLRSHGALRHRFVDLTKIHAFSSRVGRTAQMDDIAAVAVTEIAEHLRASSVALVVFGDAGRTVEAWLGDKRLLDALPHSVDDDTWAHALTPGALSVVDGESSDGISRVLGWQGRRSALVAALGDEGKVFGVLVVADRQGASVFFDGHDIERLRPLGQQLAVALRKGQLHDQIQHEALHDPLTGAPNRAYFDAWTTQFLAEMQPETQAAFMMVDLDRFKEVNDTLGHAAGDLLLTQVCERLVDAVGEDAFVARLGGDEFAIALPDSDDESVQRVIDRVSRRLEEPIDLDGTVVAINGSIGVACAPRDGTDVTTIMRRADLAMYDAKQRHERASHYRAELDSTDILRLGLLGDLREALTNGSIDVHYQPKVDLRTGRVVGMEALVRWTHPTEGPLAPEVFVAVAEQAGLIGQLTNHVLRASLAAHREWTRAGHQVAMAVNISPLSLMVEEFPDLVAAELTAAGVAADQLILEITERAMLGESPRTRGVLERLETLGVRLSIDDFGTGYSSLATLRSMPISELKIDRSFVAGLAAGGSDGIIVESTIQLAHNLGMTVVAEGVETSRAEQMLREAGCDLGQGYGLCRPLPAGEVLGFLELQMVPTG